MTLSFDVQMTVEKLLRKFPDLPLRGVGSRESPGKYFMIDHSI